MEIFGRQNNGKLKLRSDSQLNILSRFELIYFDLLIIISLATLIFEWNFQ